MKRNLFIYIKLALIAAAISLPAAAYGHNLWINAIDFSPQLSKRTGAHTKVYFGFGHKFPVQDFLDRDKLTEFKMVRPNGDTLVLEPGSDGFLTTPLILKTEGAHMVTAATKTGFYSMYFKKGRVHHKLGSKEGLSDVILSLYYENYTKALINVGATSKDAYATPVGHGIEIVPIENPYLKKTGDTLQLKVLHKGRPASFCSISATYVGFSTAEDYAFSNKTNAEGVSTIRLLSPGQWIVRAVVRKPAEEQLRDKCNEEKYSATISFEVQ